MECFCFYSVEIVMPFIMARYSQPTKMVVAVDTGPFSTVVAVRLQSSERCVISTLSWAFLVSFR